jgi:hypothetical protein
VALPAGPAVEIDAIDAAGRNGALKPATNDVTR